MEATMGIEDTSAVERICREEVDDYIETFVDGIVAKHGMNAPEEFKKGLEDYCLIGNYGLSEYGADMPPYSHFNVYFEDQGVELSHEEWEWYQRTIEEMIFEGVCERVNELQEGKGPEDRRAEAARIASEGPVEIPEIHRDFNLDPCNVGNIDAYIVTADPDGETGLLTLLCPCADEIACDYGTYKVLMGDGGTVLLKEIEGKDVYGRCTNEDDEGNIVERDCAKMADDAYEMSVRFGNVYNGGIPVCVGMGTPGQPDPLSDFPYSEMCDEFKAMPITREHGVNVLPYDLTEAICIGMNRSRELLRESKVEAERSERSKGLSR